MLKTDRRLLTLMVWLTAAILVFMTGTPLWRPRVFEPALRKCRKAVEILSVSSTAISPSGTPHRHPESRHPGVPLIHSERLIERSW